MPPGAFAFATSTRRLGVLFLPVEINVGAGKRPVQSAMASTMSAELGPGESPGCCSGSPARSCCGSPTGRSGARCSSRRRGSPGSRLEAAHRQGVYHTPAKTPRRQSRRSRERDQSGGPLLERRLIDLSGQECAFESLELPPEPDAAAAVQLQPAGEHATAQEIQPVRRPIDVRVRLELQIQAGRQEGADGGESVPKLRGRLAPQGTIVHVPHVAVNAEVFLDQPVEPSQVEVREMLRSQAADRQPAPGAVS